MNRTKLAVVVLATLGAVSAVAFGRDVPMGKKKTPVAPSAPRTPAPPPAPKGMVSIPAGSFWMGFDDGDAGEAPQRRVTVNAFFMDKTEVTVMAYGACVSSGGCPPRTSVTWADIKDEEVAKYSVACNYGKADRVSHPMNCVSATDAEAFCAHAGKRLPTEEEWEYAARGTDGRKYPWGNEAPSANLLNACGPECVSWMLETWVRDWDAMYATSDAWATTAPVASFPAGASPFGLFDMAGNVWEWTSSGYEEPNEAAGSASKRVFRGGGWLNVSASFVHAARRLGHIPSERYNFVGFRCARSM